MHVDDVAELDGLSAEEVAAARTAAADRGARGLPAPAAAAHPPAGADQAAQPGAAPPGARGVGGPGVAPASTTTGRWRCASRALRAERARLLGFDTHADLVLADQTARTTEAVDAMLASMVPASVANAEAEAAVLAESAARGRRRAGAVGLGLLQRAGPRRALRRRHRGPAALVRAGPGAGRRGLPRRRAALRLPVHPAARPGRLPPRGAGLGGDRRRRRRRSGCTWATTSPARASAAAPG